MPSDGEVATCATCAYFGLRNGTTLELIEADSNCREDGHCSRRRDFVLWCKHQAFDLEDEYGKAAQEETNVRPWAHDNRHASKFVLDQERKQCAKEARWARYVPGQSPAEYDDMNWQQMALDAQHRVIDLQTSYNDFREKLAEKDERMAQRIQALEETRLNETQRYTRKLATWQIVAVIIITLLGAIASSVMTAWLTK